MHVCASFKQNLKKFKWSFSKLFLAKMAMVNNDKNSVHRRYIFQSLDHVCNKPGCSKNIFPANLSSLDCHWKTHVRQLFRNFAIINWNDKFSVIKHLISVCQKLQDIFILCSQCNSLDYMYVVWAMNLIRQVKTVIELSHAVMLMCQ